MDSVSTPLLQTIEPDEPMEHTVPSGHINVGSGPRAPVVLSPGARASQPMATNASDAEAGIAGILRQSAHPLALLCLYLFRIAAIAVYVLCGFFTNNFVISTVMVVVLLAMDFWNCRNVAGRILVGLRYWNQVDEDGESYWVFESRDPSRPANPVDSRMFWIALYAFPLFWLALFVVSLLKFNISFIPIVVLALIFNFSNAVGFTYADRDAKQKWANNLASSGWGVGMGGFGGQVLAGVVKQSVGRVFK
ncbi:uncharacterized protein FIBRA_03001 [Fibroporia radiculosa]|uniref:Golgi apparatus membrane protein TVP23 n=1 Tax=Fibroporia radiculosa TaxID=599839 RepID=J4H259_9APHY|nr:uncharacterized protein FIBRA_03001 [Fibroporia radiculosa]CCM00954.1 predicted protein [Fibroporia radiculosa]